MTTSENARPGSGLRIGDVARLCGISTRAVRHYHAIGLLPEPSRDDSGYRRYATADVIALVRVVRLRALGMPLPRIDARVDGAATIGHELRALADELTVEIARLTALRDRIDVCAESGALADPGEALADALREYGSLPHAEALAPAEAEAAALVDALHPGGLPAALDTARDLTGDPENVQKLNGLLLRYQALTDVSQMEEIGALAADVAAAFPRPDDAPRPVDLAVMDSLLGDRLTAGQRRFMVELRRLHDVSGGSEQVLLA